MSDAQVQFESAICDAAAMARMTVEFIGRALGFDEVDPGAPLDDTERDLLLFAVTETMGKVERVRTLFYQNLQA